MSGEEALAIQLADVTATSGSAGQAITGRTLKVHLQSLCGQPRFQQRLLLSDGQILADDAVLDGPAEVQLISLPFSPSSLLQIDQLYFAAREDDIPRMEELLQRPQDPNLVRKLLTDLHGPHPIPRPPLMARAAYAAPGIHAVPGHVAADPSWKMFVGHFHLLCSKSPP